MIEASYYRKTEDGNVECELCPNHCKISRGKKGICRVRENIGGTLFSLNYGVRSSAALDPIEKKPLANFMPGKKIFSIGSIGCNLSCMFCQNWSIATTDEASVRLSEKDVSPKMVVDAALNSVKDGNIGIAYTYNEPTVWFEYMRDIAIMAKENGLKNVMVSNGYIEQKPLDELLPIIDAFNIDLKGNTNDFYKNLTKSSIAPVLNTLKTIVKSGKHLEIAYLVIPGENDDPGEFRKTIEWIKKELGDDISLHINRYFPCHKLQIPATPIESLRGLYEIAKEYLPKAYIGNV